MKTFDVCIIGAGFSGLSCAEELARQGLSVALIDKKACLSQNIHTTGIIVQEAIREWEIPDQLLRPINRVQVYLPNLKSLEIQSPSYNFYLTDTGGILKHKLESLPLTGLDVFLSSLVKKIHRVNDHYVIDGLDISARYLVIANGANSSFLNEFGFQKNHRFLAGHELEFSLDDFSKEDIMRVFIHSKICRGYIGWLVPGVTSVQVGLAVDKGEKLSIDDFLEHIRPIAPFKKSRSIGARAGLIPVGGTMAQVFKDNILVMGDAAGYVSPLTAGGIHTAMRYGRTGAKLLAKLNNASATQKNFLVKDYQKKLPHFYLKHFSKRLYNSINKELFWRFLYATGLLKIMSRFVFFLKKRLK